MHTKCFHEHTRKHAHPLLQIRIHFFFLSLSLTHAQPVLHVHSFSLSHTLTLEARAHLTCPLVTPVLTGEHGPAPVRQTFSGQSSTNSISLRRILESWKMSGECFCLLLPALDKLLVLLRHWDNLEQRLPQAFTLSLHHTNRQTRCHWRPPSGD